MHAHFVEHNLKESIITGVAVDLCLHSIYTLRVTTHVIFAIHLETGDKQQENKNLFRLQNQFLTNLSNIFHLFEAS